MDMPKAERDRLLSLSDVDLERLCRTDRFRGSGRGGQKRNTTDSSVRVTHTATGMTATAADTRSQKTNRTLALRRLRYCMALTCRAAPQLDSHPLTRPGRKSRDYLFWMADVLDCLEANEFRVSDAARQLASTTGRLVRDLAKDPDLWQRVNSRRRDVDLPPLRMPS